MIRNARTRCSISSRVRALSRRRFGVATQIRWSGRLQRRPARSWRCLSCLGEPGPSGTRQKVGGQLRVGGHGTIRHAAEACAAQKRYLIPLPGGTMNMLARALYGDMSWEDALNKTLAAPLAKVLSGGCVAEKQFFIPAIVGAPTLWAGARESIRERDIGDAIEKGTIAFQNMFETKVQYFLSETKKGEAEAVAVICPIISEEMSDSEPALEVAAVEVENVAEVVGLLTAAAFGKWRDNRNIVLTKTNQMR